MRGPLFALGLLAACTQAPRAQPRPTGDAPAAVTAAAPDAGAVAHDAASGCYATCLQANQMRAVAIEQIERDCRAECAATP